MPLLSSQFPYSFCKTSHKLVNEFARVCPVDEAELPTISVSILTNVLLLFSLVL